MLLLKDVGRRISCWMDKMASLFPSFPFSLQPKRKSSHQHISGPPLFNDGGDGWGIKFFKTS